MQQVVKGISQDALSNAVFEFLHTKYNIEGAGENQEGGARHRREVSLPDEEIDRMVENGMGNLYQLFEK